MKIKLPFTEKFLWDLYKFIDKTEGFLSFFIDADKPYNFPGIENLTPAQFRIFKKNWEYNYKKRSKDFARLVYRLKERGYLKTLRVKEGASVIITPKGLEKVFKIKMKLVEKKKRKDKKWQMVLFDIPETKRKQRNWFRKGLQYLGYQKLQRSIWVCPYDVLKETKDLIKRYKLELYVELLLVKKIGLS